MSVHGCFICTGLCVTCIQVCNVCSCLFYLYGLYVMCVRVCNVCTCFLCGVMSTVYEQHCSNVSACLYVVM